jgi:hypothetical protein
MYFVPGQPADQGPPSLRTALATVRRDTAWWHKLLVGGLLALSGIGLIMVEGYAVESLDNTRNGFPTPLPRWRDWSLKAIQGLFGLIIDFFYFVFPVLLGGLVWGCGAIGLAVFGGAATLRIVGWVVVVLVLVWIAAMWLLGVSVVAKQFYVSEGVPRDALSAKPIRTVLDSNARSLYFRARLHSLPPYFVALVLLLAAWYSQRWGTWPTLFFLWIALAALLGARLVAIQLYGAATQQLDRQRLQQRRAARA